jgi:hypothetical protein
MFTWLGIFKLCLQLLNGVAGIIKDKQLMDAGEAKATAKSLAKTIKTLEIGKAIEEEVEALSDEDLNAELRGDK